MDIKKYLWSLGTARDAVKKLKEYGISANPQSIVQWRTGSRRIHYRKAAKIIVAAKKNEGIDIEISPSDVYGTGQNIKTKGYAEKRAEEVKNEIDAAVEAGVGLYGKFPKKQEDKLKKLIKQAILEGAVWQR